MEANTNPNNIVQVVKNMIQGVKSIIQLINDFIIAVEYLLVNFLRDIYSMSLWCGDLLLLHFTAFLVAILRRRAATDPTHFYPGPSLYDRNLPNDPESAFDGNLISYYRDMSRTQRADVRARLRGTQSLIEGQLRALNFVDNHARSWE
ncbi:hypothetical protein F4821DRAFT_275741 [Hypoxylon rubiginosum]|uniref:Uncharacterized protein n=1 Tax=Hypoxylon rubiginosum TaxID=110542 RepID=A0ACC0DAD7_9PEZI|nr:hypothetical protein F4821DRAFT_275741 [Hypoxylon rubiginosum]